MNANPRESESKEPQVDASERNRKRRANDPERASSASLPILRAARSGVSYERVLLKLTGEIFRSPARANYVIREIARAARSGCELAIVIGGGNIIRGRQVRTIDRVGADLAGMMATVVNGIMLERLLETNGVPAAHLSSFEIHGVVRRFSAPAGREVMSRRRVLVLSGGTGNPLFSTDTAAALRACELGAQAILKGTKVKGVYSADPQQVKNARFLPRLTYDQALRRKLAIMDATAFALCTENRIPIIVFDIFKPGNLAGVIKGEPIGSRVC
jgi:uridylate kinase